MPILDKVQKRAAQNLRIVRPTVYAGTNAIMDSLAASAWHAIVTDSMAHHSIANGEQTRAFCDLAGVAD